MKNEEKQMFFEELIKHPNTIQIPEDLSSKIQICEYLIKEAKKENIEQIMAFLVRLDEFFIVWTARKIYRKLGHLISGTKAWINWWRKHNTDDGFDRIGVWDIKYHKVLLSDGWSQYIKDLNSGKIEEEREELRKKEVRRENKNIEYHI